MSGSWLATKGQEKPREIRFAVLVAVLSVDLGVLGWFKYAGFFAGIVAPVMGCEISLPQVVLPLGISFYTFTQIAFVIDSYRGHVKRWRLADYLLFVTYFPHLIAGPVLRHDEVIPQFAYPTTFVPSMDNLVVGGTIFVIGLFKKVVLADNVAVFASPLFSDLAPPPMLSQAWLGALAYSLQLYFDFSGYSDMAVGLSRLFGVSLPINFDSPYKASSVIDFWGRWHMTLSRFLRDYLYIPLGGKRRGEGRRFLNIFLTMVLGGLWHGAGWTFIVWGGVHGAYLAINHGWRRIRQNIHSPVGTVERGAGRLLTLIAVVVAWVFFRSPDLPTAFGIIEGMAGGNGFGGVPTMESLVWITGLLLVALFAPNSMQIMAAYHRPPDGQRLRTGTCHETLRWRPNIFWAALTALMIVSCAAFMNRTSEFLYFQF